MKRAPAAVFREAQHPRDRNGQWIDKGGRVRVSFRGVGVVTGWRANGREDLVDVQLDNGNRITSPTRSLTTVTPAGGPAQPKPKRPKAPEPTYDTAWEAQVAHLRRSRGITAEEAADWPARASDYYRGDNEYMVVDDEGHEHYGEHGAAGVLVRHRDEDGTLRYLLQLRSAGVQHGNTWSTPGGAMEGGESPEQAAAREAMEELGMDPSVLRRVQVSTDDHGGWAYHTVVLEADRMFAEGEDPTAEPAAPELPDPDADAGPAGEFADLEDEALDEALDQAYEDVDALDPDDPALEAAEARLQALDDEWLRRSRGEDLQAPEGNTASGAWESNGVRWVTAEEIPTLPLHPGFAGSWQKIVAETEGLDATEPVPLPAAVAEGKVFWRREDHPRDRNGRWIDKHGEVIVASRGRGTVTGWRSNEGPHARIDVHLDNGTRVTVDPRYVTAVGEPRPGSPTNLRPPPPLEAPPAPPPPPAPARAAGPVSPFPPALRLWETYSETPAGQAVAAVLDFTHPQTGWRIDIESGSAQPGEIMIDGVITDPATGDTVGRWRRTIVRNITGAVRVQHTLLQIEPDHQGQGFADAWYDHLIAGYPSIGVGAVAVNANIDVGGYAWAQRGFEWAEDRMPQELAEQVSRGLQPPPEVLRAMTEEQLTRLEDLRSELDDHAAGDIDTELTPKQIANALSDVRWEGRTMQGRRIPMWPGKQALLGSEWDGVLVLTDTDPVLAGKASRAQAVASRAQVAALIAHAPRN